MKFNLLFLFLLLANFLFSQRYFEPEYNFSDNILKGLDTHRQNYLASWKFSFIGEYKKALELWDKDVAKKHNLSDRQINYFNIFKPIDAKRYIYERAEKERIIILNEAHQQPYHRVFTTSILSELYKRGYRYFGAEALWPDDSINRRKYPILKSGYYIYEPNCANMIREAINIGYNMFSYEPSTSDLKKDTIGINYREIGQAKNIKKILDKDTNAKILIHCGFDHIVENEYPKWGKAMAGRLIEYTGINPFTIDQVQFTEHSSPEFESSYFNSLKLDKYSFLIDSNGNLFNGSKDFKGYDARLYHPRTKYIYGRPHWIFENRRKPYFIKNIKLKYPWLVFAYLANENLDIQNPSYMPVPFDIIEIKSIQDQKALSLKKGAYIIKVKNKIGEIQTVKTKIY